MKKMKWTLFILLIIGLISSCGKERCPGKKLTILNCDYDYNSVNEQIYFVEGYFIYYNLDTNFKVIDSLTYDSIFKQTKPFGNIDFNTHFIIGVNRNTNPGDGITKKAVICENVINKKLKLTVAYSLSGQCLGSEIIEKIVSAWVVVPNKYKDYTIEYEVLDIDPR